jgi:histidine triad (HIT) family protein
MDQCVFCKLVKKELPVVSVYEDEQTLAFMELNPSSPGHLMVIHKQHGYSIFEYTKEELSDLMVSVQRVARKVENGLNTDSLTIGINHHEKKGVPHLHVHIIPRWENDKGGVLQSIVSNPPKESREVIAEKIRKA